VLIAVILGTAGLVGWRLLRSRLRPWDETPLSWPSSARATIGSLPSGLDEAFVRACRLLPFRHSPGSGLARYPYPPRPATCRWRLRPDRHDRHL